MPLSLRHPGRIARPGTHAGVSALEMGHVHLRRGQWHPRSGGQSAGGDSVPQQSNPLPHILHASWPAGLVLGGVVGWVLGEGLKWHWKAQLALFLVPTALYGLMFLGQHMPKSEALRKGLASGKCLRMLASSAPWLSVSCWRCSSVAHWASRTVFPTAWRACFLSSLRL